MKIITRLSFICISIIVATIIYIQSAQAQNYLHESFDSTTFPPSGWSNVYVRGGTYGSVIDTVWQRVSSYSPFTKPSTTTHAGTGMALYNSWGLYTRSEALLITPAMDFSAYVAGLNRLTFWFYRSNDIWWNGYETDTLNVWINKGDSLAGAVKLKTLIDGIKSAPVISTSGWYKYTIDLPDSFSSSNHVYILFDAVSAYNVDLLLDDVSIDHIQECYGVPNVTIKPKAEYTPICVGGTFSLSGIGDNNVVGQKYQWQQSSAATGPWADISGATDTIYTTTASFSGTAYLRLKDSCAGSGNVAYSLPDTVVQVAPTYAAIPYVQDFESWQNYCNVLDVPGSNWYNVPAFGLGSWRRDDQGCAYGGWPDTACNMYPVNSLGGYTYISGAHCARFHSSGELSAAATPWEAALDLYIDCSGPGNKLLQFYFKNQASWNTPYAGYNNDSLCVYMSTDGGATFSKLWGADTAQEWKKIRVQLPSSSATTVIRFLGKRNGGNPIGVGETVDLSDIGLDSVYVGPACAGLASGGSIIPSGSLTGCPAGSYSLSIAGIPPAGGITYQWQKATAPFSSFTDITGATDIRYTTPVLFDTVQYRLKVTCPYTTPATVLNSAVTTLKITPIPYALINTSSTATGYHYSFENWANRCAADDAPVIGTGLTVSNWANYPATGENSWRREDQGVSANWSYPWALAPYGYTPLSYDSSHSARFYTFYHYGSSRTPGNLFLFIDCSADTNTKELQYSANIDSVSRGYIPDTLASWLSTDGGTTYRLLQKDYNGNGTWKQVKISLPGNTGKTIIRFQGIYGSPNGSASTGLGLDNVKILLNCNGKPTAGTLRGDSVCVNDTITARLIGASEAIGLYYVWQQSADNVVWTNIKGYSATTLKMNFTASTYLRAIAVCSNTGQTDTGNAALFIVRPYYRCYCNPVSNSSYYGVGAFGRVTIAKQTGDTVFDHITTKAYPIYNDWAMRVAYGDLASLKGYINCMDTITPASLYVDSSYKLSIEEVSPYWSYYGGYPINTYIDYNHNSDFDSSELIFNKSAASVSSPVATDSFAIPHDALTGLTGMRLLLGVYFTSPLNPCGRSFNYGEIRDYLVNIGYAPCNGPVNAGRSISHTTELCFGESFVIIDNSHDHKTPGTTWNWLTSTDRVNWKNVPLTIKSDTLTEVFDTAAWYRLQMVCIATHDTTYSNNIEISPDSPYRCYCYSAAIGRSVHDSCDINSFSFGPYTVNKRGSHLLNVLATEGHERFDDSILDLYADTTYHVTMSPTYRTAFSGNAKITLFIDYNNNLRYDIPGERLWTAYTSAALWDLTTDIKIPDSVTTDVPTGMRVILNNNIKGTKASDDACDAYTSGETIDFVVRFNRAWTTGVGSISNLEHLVMYPNPTDGKFKISFNSQATIKKLQISVTNMTGQQVFARNYTNTQGQFNTEIDLSAAARGVYFVTFMADGERMIRKMVLK